MKLQNQVCTLAQAKRLKELGVEQDSYFFHLPGIALPCTLSKKEMIIFKEYYSAFTVAELGVMMPDRFMYYGDQCFFESTRYSDNIEWIAGVHTVWAHDKPVVAKKYFPANTEAEARAELLIHLLEKQITTVEEVNQRLKAA